MLTATKMDQLKMKQLIDADQIIPIWSIAKHPHMHDSHQNISYVVY